MKIALDVDDTLSEFVRCILEINNHKVFNNDLPYKKHLEFEDITDELEVIMGKNVFQDAFYHEMKNREAIKHLKLIPGAQEFVENLKKYYEVIFVTAPSFQYKNWCDERVYWLRENFNAKDREIFFVHNKSAINADVLIDDRPKYLEEWEKTKRPCIRMVKPWNMKSAGFPANSYNDVFFILNHICALK